MLTLRDRYLGAMVGTLCGDAMGAPVEWFRRSAVADYFRKYGYAFRDYENPWDIKKGKIPPSIVKAGQPTDDSELAAALATSLVAKKGVCSEDIYVSLRKFIIDRKSILTDKAFGSGGTLRAALEPPTYQESVAKFEAGEIKTPPSNGSLMRCIGIPLLYLGAPLESLVDRAVKQSMVTHRNEQSVTACAGFSVFVTQVLGGDPVGEAWLRSVSIFNRYPAFAEVAALPVTEPSDDEIWLPDPRGPGDVMLSLRIAVWAATTSFNFEDGIRKAISVGGDTDTYAAIAGGVLGAKFGYQGIPVEWRVSLRGREIMEKLGSDLYDLAISR